MITRLYHESIDVGHDLGNFTSFLRVCALRYLELELSGDVPVDTRVSIASLDADHILATRSPEPTKPTVPAGRMPFSAFPSSI